MSWLRVPLHQSPSTEVTAIDSHAAYCTASDVTPVPLSQGTEFMPVTGAFPFESSPHIAYGEQRSHWTMPRKRPCLWWNGHCELQIKLQYQCKQQLSPYTSWSECLKGKLGLGFAGPLPNTLTDDDWWNLTEENPNFLPQHFSVRSWCTHHGSRKIPRPACLHWGEWLFPQSN